MSILSDWGQRIGISNPRSSPETGADPSTPMVRGLALLAPFSTDAFGIDLGRFRDEVAQSLAQLEGDSRPPTIHLA